MSRSRLTQLIVTAWVSASASAALGAEPQLPPLEPLKFNHPGLVVDLGVGLWATPLPMDYDEDGDLDLVVACPDKPYNGVYLFENPGGDAKTPVFKPGVRVSDALQNLQISYVDGQPRVLRAGEEMVDFRSSGIGKRVKVPVTVDQIHPKKQRVRANQWRYVDYDGDGTQDLIVGVEDWADYGWDDAFNEQGEWTAGPLHGWVYYVHNAGTNEKPKYANAVKIEADGKPIDGYGMPSPSFADYDGDGDLDLVCGEFLDGLTYYENVGTRTEPRYAAGRPLADEAGRAIRMDLQMIQVVAIDWTRDGKPDLVVGEEDGRVALLENTGKRNGGAPAFARPVFFQQQAEGLKFGALVTPVGFDWDGDGDEDIVTGNSAGYVGFIENLGGGAQPRWAAPRYLEADGRIIRPMAGPNGSIQGPAEAKWGYTTLSVADWDHDDLPDLIVNTILGEVVWYRNTGTRAQPRLAAARAIEVAWPGGATKPEWNWKRPEGNHLVTQWRTTPVVVDATGDGLNDLVMLDRDGFLSLFERKRVDGTLTLQPPRHAFYVEAGEPSVFDHNHKPVAYDLNKDGRNDLAGLDAGHRVAFYRAVPGQKEPALDRFADRTGDGAYASPAGDLLPLRLNGGWAGRSGRRKLHVGDFDGDGRPDLLVNGTNVDLLRNVADAPGGGWVFRDAGPLSSTVLAGHDTSPALVDFDGDGVRDLLVGAEDGRFYFLRNPRATGNTAVVR